jgi:hypothetical protein
MPHASWLGRVRCCRGSVCSSCTDACLCKGEPEGAHDAAELEHEEQAEHEAPAGEGVGGLMGRLVGQDQGELDEERAKHHDEEDSSSGDFVE